MPSKEITFTIKLPIEYVWSFMTDRREVGCLFPGCIKVDIINDVDSIWTVKFSLGPFSRTLQMNTHTTESVDLERLSWVASGENMKAAGRVDLRKISDEDTEVRYHIEGHVTGRFSMLQDIVVAEKLGELSRAFVKNIKARLEYHAEKES